MTEKTIYTIPFRDTLKGPRSKSAKQCVKKVREFIEKSKKTKNVKIDGALNNALWFRGISKPPRSIRVEVSEADGSFTASLAK